MPLTYNLPKLSNESFPDPAVAGVWMASARLDDMAASLELANDDAQIDALKSLPDPWARPLLFNQALTTQDHIAKRDARDQWRGLLALLALRHFYPNSYLLSVQTVDLNAAGSGNPRFRAVLKRLMPTDSIMADLTWLRIGVMTIRAAGEDRFSVGQPQAVGLMVPNCLVAPARGVRQISMPSVPWLRDGLRDPCTCDDIPGNQWVALREYLGNIFERLQAGDISFSSQAIREEIRLFAQDCLKHINSAGAQPYTPQFDGFSEPLPHSFYSVLGNAPMPHVEDPKITSQCEVRLNPDNGLVGSNEPGKLAGVILIDQQIAERTLSRRAQDVRLFKKYSLGTIDQGGNRRAMTEEAEREGYLVITPDQVFTDKLVQLVNEGRVDSHGPQWERFLLPISPLALFMVPRDRLTHRLSIADRGDKFEVRLTVDLVAPDEQSRAPSHTITKMYDKATQVAQESVPDDIILWPDVGMSNWPWNFMRYSFNSEYEMAPRFAASMRSLADTIAVRSKNNRDEGLALLRSLASKDDLIFERMDAFFQGNLGELKTADGRLIAHRFRFTDLEDGVAEQHILGLGADFLFFGMTPEEGGDLVPAGCMMLPERRATQGQGTMEIAVDFGTTNTVVYLKSGDRTERMMFQPRVSRPISSRLAEVDQFAFDCLEFFPAAEVASPFPTVMHRRSFDLRGSTSLQGAMASGYHGYSDNIFFMPEVADKFGTAVERQEKKQLAFDLKWSPDPEIRRMVKRFLRQIVLMSTVEAINREVKPENIKWHFSYPQAWDAAQSRSFQDSVKGAWRDILAPVLGKNSNADSYIDFETEGAAALRYFTKGPDHIGMAGSLILMFDIGGGTTEIAIYQDDVTIWRSSFRLAGGDFFTRFLSQNIAIFDQFPIGGSSIQDVLRKFSADSSIKHFVELYISQTGFNETFADSYPMFSDEPNGVGLMNAAMVALAGICYYSGLVLRDLMSKGLVKERDIRNLTLAFAGRGSSFFRYFGRASDEMSVLGQVARMVSDVVHAKVGGHEDDAASSWELTNSGECDHLFSTLPKHEVAHGMLCGDEKSRHKRARSVGTPLGEKIVLTNGEELGLGADQLVEDIPAGVRLDEIAESEFDRFLELLAIRTGLKVKLDSKGGSARKIVNNNARTAMISALSKLERASDDESGETLEIEPPFITKLRSLVHILARNIDERQNLLTVQNGDPRV